MRTRLLRAALLLAALLPLAAVADEADAQTRRTIGSLYDPGVRSPVTPVGPPDTTGLRFRVAEVRTGARPVLPPPPWERIAREDADRLLARLPALPPRAMADSFAFPAPTPPPPVAGRTRLASWPPRVADVPLPRPAPAPLVVTRVQPEGDIRVGSEVVIAFSAPMVPLTSVAAVQQVAPPARITPAVEGRWTWLDVRTLRFVPADRLPGSTTYRVEVPAGIRSADGRALAEPVRFSFSTPPAQATGGWPWGGGVSRTPVIVMAFDQAVEPAVLLPFLRVTADSVPVAVRLATAAELAADAPAARIAAGLPAGRWIALRARETLPYDALVSVTLAAGVRSAEGPRTTTEAQGWDFRTYGPLRLRERDCGWSGPCRPGFDFRLVFSNPLSGDTAAVRRWVTVEPAIADLAVRVVGTQITVSGATQPRTTYRVRISPEVRDTFGQTLGAPAEAVFRVTVPLPFLAGPELPMLVLPPDAPRTVSFYHHTVRRLRLRVMRVTPDDWRVFRQGISPTEKGGPARLPGTAVVDRVVTVDAAPGVLTETAVELAPALRDGVGHALVAMESLEWTAEEGTPASYVWVQATRLGVTALADGDRLLAWISSLDTGAPVTDARVELRPDGGTAATDATGGAWFRLPGKNPQGGAYLVVRRGDDTAILPEQLIGAGMGRFAYGGGWRRRDPGRPLVWYSFTDRNLYRPGEEVHFKAWVRRIDGTAGNALRPAGAAGDSVSFTVRDPRGAELATGRGTLTAAGGVEGRFRIPAGTPLGHARIDIDLLSEPGTDHGLGFQVQEFRRPEYTVSATAEGGPYVVGGHAEVRASARYYSGGSLPGAPVAWRLNASDGWFSPPGWAGWTFGGAAPERDGGRPSVTVAARLEGRTDAAGDHVIRVDFDRATPPRPYVLQADAVVTDVNRQAWQAGASLLVHPAEVYVGLRSDVRWIAEPRETAVDVAVVGVSGTAVAGRPVRVTAERLEWRRVDGSWREQPTDAQTCEVVSSDAPQSCRFRTGPGAWRFSGSTTDAAGRPARTDLRLWGWYYPRGLAGVDTEEEGVVKLEAERERYAPGDTARLLVRLPFFPARGVLTVRRGTIVRTLPFQSDSAVAVVRVPVTEEDVPDVTVALDVVGAADRDGRRHPSATPASFAAGSVALSVPPDGRRLTVRAVPSDTVLAPGDSASVALEVRDAAGRPVRDAEVALVVVDEAILALTGYAPGDPLPLFHPARGDFVSGVHLRSAVLAAPADTSARPGDVTGIVVGVDGRPVAGASVSAGTVRTATGADGRFRLTGLAPGAYDLSVAAVGFTRATRPIRVSDDVPVSLRVVMVASALHLESLVVTAQGRASAERAYSMAPPPPPPPPAPPPPPVAADMAGGAGQAAGPAIAVRSDFNPLAVFAGAVRTDGDGRATVAFRLPGNLTRYRVMAVAVEGVRRYGMGESALTARLPLMVRPSAPRFLNWGDRFELPVVLQNGTDRAMTVDVAARASGLSINEPGRRVTIPANDRVEVRFPAEAWSAGTSVVQIAAASPARSDAAMLSLPVYTPATTEAFATYGNQAGGAVTLPLDVPVDALPGFGGLEVTTSSTALAELTDAFLYLVRYPYECTEQLSSRILSVAALRDVLTAFRVEGLPSADSLRASVSADLARIAARQRGDGGFGFWDREGETHPFATVHAALAMQLAREKGFEVDARVMDRALGYLAGIERQAPAWYPSETKRALTAYAAYVLARAGRGDDAERAVRSVLAGTSSQNPMPLEMMGWLVSASAGRPSLAAPRAEMLRQLRNRATETASTATFATRYTEGEYLLLHSDRRTDAVVLDALMATDPRNELIAKTVRGLLGSRVRGRWASTQENGWVLLALDRYFRQFEGQTPEFVARVWLGERLVQEQPFVGRTTDRGQLEVPMDALREAGARELTIGQEGPGRLYWRAGLRYAPRDLDLLPADRGFAVERTYEAVDDSGDVVRRGDGRWQVRAGALVRVTVTMTAPSRRLHVALVDPLPAGFEALNPALRGTERPSSPSGPPRPLFGGSDGGWGWSWRAWWYQHDNLRDDRAEAFTQYLPAGTYTYSYVARATTPGEFIVPPARAEEMYSPETFGRGRTDRVTVGVDDAR